MKARISILTVTAALAIAASAVQPAGATIPWAAHSSADVRTADRSLAVVTEAYSWRNYVHSYASVQNVYRDALDRRGDTRTVSRLADGYDRRAYVHGGAPLNVAKAIVAAGKIGSGDRTVQSAKHADFRYVR